MALTAKEAAALVVIGLDEALLKGQGVAARTIKSLGRAAVKVAPYVGRAAVAQAPRAAAGLAATAAAAPITTGIGLGGAALATPMGQELLQAAAERGAADRIRAQQALDQFIFERTMLPLREAERAIESPTVRSAARGFAKRKVSKYSKAIKAGMSAVKKSKFGGKPGEISNAKKTFATVNKVASAVNKGKKVAKKGITGTIARAVRRIL